MAIAESKPNLGFVLETDHSPLLRIDWVTVLGIPHALRVITEDYRESNSPFATLVVPTTQVEDPNWIISALPDLNMQRIRVLVWDNSGLIPPEVIKAFPGRIIGYSPSTGSGKMSLETSVGTRETQEIEMFGYVLNVDDLHDHEPNKAIFDRFNFLQMWQHLVTEEKSRMGNEYDDEKLDYAKVLRLLQKKYCSWLELTFIGAISKLNEKGYLTTQDALPKILKV